MIIHAIYEMILLYIIAILTANIFKEKKFTMQLTAALAVLPLLLRFLMIK